MLKVGCDRVERFVALLAECDSLVSFSHVLHHVTGQVGHVLLVGVTHGALDCAVLRRFDLPNLSFGVVIVRQQTLQVVQPSMDAIGALPTTFGAYRVVFLYDDSIDQ